jgi:alpha-1,6-mannosyltransferase
VIVASHNMCAHQSVVSVVVVVKSCNRIARSSFARFFVALCVLVSKNKSSEFITTTLRVRPHARAREHTRTHAQKKEDMRRFFTHQFFDCLFFLLVLSYVRIAPYTKVEESFNTQAVHDVIFHANELDRWDHKEFPGVVPRTFVGPLLLGKTTKVIARVMESVANSNAATKSLFRNERIWGELKHVVETTLNAEETFGRTKMHYQVIMRMILGAASTFSLHRFHSVVGKNFGNGVAACASVLTLAQFHLAFYASRPLPNIFAFVLTTFALSLWLEERKGLRISRSVLDAMAVALVSMVVVVFRCDNILLLAPLGLHVTLFRATGLYDASLRIIGNVMSMVTAMVIFAYVSITIDSKYWDKEYLWPEWEVLSFNNPMGANQSQQYGTKPFLWYAYSALPRMLLIAYPLSMYGFMYERRCRPAFAIASFFVFAYSFLGHKELRFLFPILPLFNFCAACGMHRLNLNRKKSTVVTLLHALAWLGVLFSCAISVGLFANASVANYPGGEALAAFHQLNPERGASGRVRIHIDNHCAQTGASRFGQVYHDHNVILYNKRSDYGDESHLRAMLHDDGSRGYDWLINENEDIPGYESVRDISGFTGVQLNKKFPFWPPLLVKRDVRVKVWKRSNEQE